jgi:hypothetical protein
VANLGPGVIGIATSPRGSKPARDEFRELAILWARRVFRPTERRLNPEHLSPVFFVLAILDPFDL